MTAAVENRDNRGITELKLADQQRKRAVTAQVAGKALDQQSTVLPLLHIGAPTIAQQLEASLGGTVAKACDGEPVTLGLPTYQELLREPSAGKVDALIGNFLFTVEIIGNQFVDPKFKLHGGHFDWCAVLHQ